MEKNNNAGIYILLGLNALFSGYTACSVQKMEVAMERNNHYISNMQSSEEVIKAIREQTKEIREMHMKPLFCYCTMKNLHDRDYQPEMNCVCTTTPR